MAKLPYRVPDLLALALEFPVPILTRKALKEHPGLSRPAM